MNNIKYHGGTLFTCIYNYYYNKYPGGTRSLSAVNNKTNAVASFCYLPSLVFYIHVIRNIFFINVIRNIFFVNVIRNTRKEGPSGIFIIIAKGRFACILVYLLSLIYSCYQKYISDSLL